MQETSWRTHVPNGISVLAALSRPYPPRLEPGTIGKEQKPPFSGNDPGLIAWVGADTNTENAEAIRKHLLTDPYYDTSFKNFLETSPLDVIQRELFARIRWEVAAPNIDELIREVESELVVYGLSLGCSPEESKEVADSLLRAVFRSSRQRNTEQTF